MDGGGREVLTRSPAPNLVTWRGVDLIGALLCNAPDVGTLTFLAVGTGDPAWPDPPPAPSPAMTSLVAEVYRERLGPAALSFDVATGEVVVRAVLGPGEAVGELHELGLFGGDASALPESGWLFNVRRHAPIVKGAADTLERELRIAPAADLLPGARETIGRLLAGERDARGIGWLALGRGPRAAGAAKAEALAAEVVRHALAPHELRYDARTRTVRARSRFGYAEAPVEVTEGGLFGGAHADSAANSGLLVAYSADASVDHTAPANLDEAFALALSSADAVEVPNLVGQAKDAASTTLDAAGLVVGDITTRTDDTKPRNTVLEQDPAAGTAGHLGWIVDLVVSVPAQVTVPDLRGAQAAAAEGLLKSVGLALDAAGSSTVESGEPAGTILSTDPASGAIVDKGSAVKTVTAVPTTVAVPSVLGQTPEGAAIVLAESQLALADPPYETSEGSFTPRTIIKQTPATAERAAVDSIVSVTLSRGWTVEMPDITGQQAEQAAQTLAAAGATVLARLGRPDHPEGLALGARTPKEDANAPGTVVGQHPAAGAQVPLYASIDVEVAVPPTKVVPAVAGDGQADAATAITAAGLIVGSVVARMHGEGAAPGTVLDQEPRAGTRWPAGAPVDLTVASPVMVLVPDVIGTTLDVVRESLQARALTLGDVVQEAGDGNPGNVKAQDPAAGSEAPLGSGVKITVVTGVPRILDLSLEQARPLLEAVGLALADDRVEQESDSPAGSIIAQKPLPGAAADPDKLVHVTVAIQRTVEVPDIGGRDLDVARKLLAAARLTLVVHGTTESDSAPGTVLEQDPAAGQRVAPGSEVGVTVAVPVVPKKVAVPGLVGQGMDSVRRALDDVGLVLAVGRLKPSERPAGSVLEQEPAADTEVDRGSTVTVVVAAALDANTVVVRDVTGDQVADAQAALTAEGLTSATLETASDAPAGTVLNQMPVADSRVPQGSSVTLTVAVARTTRVPGLVGLTFADAQQAAGAVGLSVRVRHTFVRLGGTTVRAQDPAPGTTVPVGTVVLVALGPDLGGGPRRPVDELPQRMRDDVLRRLVNPGSG